MSLSFLTLVIGFVLIWMYLQPTFLREAYRRIRVRRTPFHKRSDIKRRPPPHLDVVVEEPVRAFDAYTSKRPPVHKS